MVEPDEAHAAMDRMLRAFDAAAADFSRLSPYLWDPIGQATVRRCGPQPGEAVLDACCGDGASALPAARLVGPTGRVDAVDLSAALIGGLERRGADVDALHAQHGDVTAWPRAGYDAVQCALGIFFFPDMTAGTDRLLGLLRPGGRAALTIWRHGSLATVGERLVSAAARARGEPAPGPRDLHLVDRIGTAQAYAGWLAERGLAGVQVVVEELHLSLTPELAWLLVIGSGFRSVLGELDDAAVAAVREGYLAALARDGIEQVDATTLIGTGTRCCHT